MFVWLKALVLMRLACVAQLFVVGPGVAAVSRRRVFADKFRQDIGWPAGAPNHATWGSGFGVEVVARFI